ncbi:hypothetical protein L917_09128 [Phytophthora nicotianae]|uniref:Uncharacterized protein n=3 Tax=Phytophthora nicotianae TaxID=4792 RepID=V9F3J2_PHYNI|nr:hypothetical protein F443_09491 [Phytophthora nicotianae P1569]ETL92605.1 hypothetical protein L917_09128 [Phytophthora nicotianae]ETM45897.1 hypothetical protein L914_09159 [Phytophthora nicotianae]ETO74785.1 hypothetical protein F444_09559 [Phytophthora nicotianae P1976]
MSTRCDTNLPLTRGCVATCDSQVHVHFADVYVPPIMGRRVGTRSDLWRLDFERASRLAVNNVNTSEKSFFKEYDGVSFG